MDRVCAQWSRAFQPVSVRSQEVWEHDFADALHGAPYLRVVATSSGNWVQSMLCIKALMNVSGLMIEAVDADIERIWTDDIAKDLRAYHSLLATEDGFIMQCAAATAGNTYITARIAVHNKR